MGGSLAGQVQMKKYLAVFPGERSNPGFWKDYCVAAAPPGCQIRSEVRNSLFNSASAGHVPLPLSFCSILSRWFPKLFSHWTAEPSQSSTFILAVRSFFWWRAPVKIVFVSILHLLFFYQKEINFLCISQKYIICYVVNFLKGTLVDFRL